LVLGVGSYYTLFTIVRNLNLSYRQLFLYLLFAGLVSSQTSLEIGRFDLSQSVIKPDFKPERFAHSAKGYIFLDIDSRQIGLWSSDSVKLRGGYGTNKSGLFDPVDLLSNQLDNYILDGTKSEITRFDNELNFVQTFSLQKDEPISPQLFSIDSRQNFYFYSLETNSIYKTRSLSSQFDLFLDLLDAGINNECISDFEFNYKDQFVLLVDCLSELYLFSRSGKLIRRFGIKIDDPIKIIEIEGSWLILNKDGMAQFFDKDPFNLNIGELIVLDAIAHKNKLHLLTKSELIIFDFVNSQ